MTADMEAFVEGGERAPLTLRLRNRNRAPLESTNITLSYKQGSGSQDEQEKKIEKKDLGTLAPDAALALDYGVVLYGSEGETRDITLKLEYKVAGSNSYFTKTVQKQVILRSPPISVGIDGPEKLSLGQSGVYVFTVRNNSATSSVASVLRLQFPENFKLEKTDSKPIGRSTSWNVPRLSKGDSFSVTVTGSFSTKEGEKSALLAQVGLAGDSPSEIGLVFSSASYDVAMRTSPLLVVQDLSSESSLNEFIKYGDRARVKITYTNSSNEPLEDVSIVLKLSGDAPIYASVEPGDGYYNSVDKTITWNKANSPDLAILAPNANGTLNLSIPIVAKGINSPVLTLTTTGVATAKLTDDVVTNVTKTYGVSGSATLQAGTQYKTSSFTNTGPIPPRPNQETTYTANLKVVAQNAIVNTKVSFTLPIYVTWRGVTSDPAVTYDAKRRTVTWNIGSLDQGKTASVDVGLLVKPSQSHVGQSPPITSGIVLDADEAVSRTHIKSTLSALTTALRNELWPTNPSIVVDK
jgi:hypothetical protein